MLSGALRAEITVQQRVEASRDSLNAPIYSWETQRAMFPDDYEHDWDEFQDLRVAAARGEFQDRS